MTLWPLQLAPTRPGHDNLAFRYEEALMRTTLVALSVAATVGLAWCQSAGAAPAGGSATMQAAAAATAGSTAQQAQYYERHTRRGVVKCYRELVIGPYVCRRFWYW